MRRKREATRLRRLNELHPREDLDLFLSRLTARSEESTSAVDKSTSGAEPRLICVWEANRIWILA